MSKLSKMKTLNGYEVCDAAARAQINGITATCTNDVYTATVDGIEELVTGVSFVMIPQGSPISSTPKLKVNDFDALPIRHRLSSNALTTSVDFIQRLVKEGHPIRVTYDEVFNNSGAWIIDTVVPDLGSNGSDIGGVYGTLQIEHGGTGATAFDEALNNLGITWGTSAPASKGTPHSIYIQIN